MAQQLPDRLPVLSRCFFDDAMFERTAQVRAWNGFSRASPPIKTFLLMIFRATMSTGHPT